MKKDELIKRLYTHKIIGDKDLMQILEEAGFKDYAISSIINKIADITNAPLPPAEGAGKSCLSCRFHNSPTYHDKMWCRDCQQLSHYEQQPTAEGAEKPNARKFLSDNGYGSGFNYTTNQVAYLMQEFAAQPQPTAEGAEEILESIVESLGEPINIHNHIFEIRPYTVEHKTEWWIFHKEMGSGEPLAQWLNKFATLHAQRIADKMVSERLKEELIRYIKWYGGFNYENMTDEMLVNEYLKSREP